MKDTHRQLPRHTRLPVALGAILLSIAWLPSASAIGIYTQGPIAGESDVLNVGTLLASANFGAGAPAVVINGVTFGPDSPAGLTGFVHGLPGDFSTQFPSGSGLDVLLSQLVYQDLHLGSASLTLSGLVPGAPYLLQLFLCNEINSTGDSSRVTIQGQSHDISDFGDQAIFIRAVFNATGTTEIVQFGNGMTSEPNRIVLNGFALSAIPEPSSLSLLGLGALVFLRRKLNR